MGLSKNSFHKLVPGLNLDTVFIVRVLMVENVTPVSL